MFQRVMTFLSRLLVKNLRDYHAGPFDRLEQAAAQKSEEALGFAAAAERARLDDARQRPTTVVPPQPRRSAAEERRRIDDMPIP
ncbi:MAG: hypothetical protein WBC44_20030 [Planctomycetaceae bacterium]